MASWLLQARSLAYGSNGALPIVSIAGVRKHLGVDTAIVTTPFTPQAWTRLPRGGGILVHRDKIQQFSGLIAERRIEWDARNNRALIKLSCLGDAQLLADRLVMPDPGRAADDQTVSDYWTFTGAVSTAMLQLVSDQAGPTCHPDRQVERLVIGADPGIGPDTSYRELFTNVLETVARWSVASGLNPGLRVTAGGSGLVCDVYQPRDLHKKVRFSADLTNLRGFTYVERAPTVTDPLSAGQGDLRNRLRRWATSTSAYTLSWRRRIWSYIDRRDTAESTDLDAANTEAIADGAATVSLAVDLTSTQAASYGRDWDLGDQVTVHVGLPGQVKVAEVADVVREVLFEVDEDGAERIRPAVGTADAKAVIPPPTVEKLAEVGDRLSSFITRK